MRGGSNHTSDPEQTSTSKSHHVLKRLPGYGCSVLATKTLLFIGEGTGGAGASPIYRAVDKATGEILHEMELPDNQTGLPMTYEHDGKQYIAMWIGGSGQPTELIAYALPD